MVQDPYRVLGIDKNATEEEIKKAYRKKAKECHPDLHPDDPDAQQKMNEVNEAYDMLKQIGVIDELYNLIGEDEIEELLSVQKTIMDTFYNQNGSTEAFIANVVDKAAQKLGISAGFAIEKLDELASDEKKINRIMGIVKPFINKK